MHGCPPDVSGMKYVIHKQPLSLDRFFLHEVTAAEAAASKLDNCFVLICLNRFQQIVQVHTFQADTEQLKVRTESRIGLENAMCTLVEPETS